MDDERPVDTDRTREELLRFYAREAADGPVADPPGHSAAYLELPKLELARAGADAPPLDADNVRATVDWVRHREDCADFGLTALLRVCYRYEDLLPERLRAAVADAATDFVYWFDEPGDREMWFCTENHQILYHAAELLAGQRFPDRTFTNDGRTGSAHRADAERRVRRWLDWRNRFGYSEWLSNHYWDEDVAALANLAAFAADDDIRERSRALIDLTLFEVAAHSHRGAFGSTHGRTYARSLLDPGREPTSALAYLCWGEGDYRRALSRSALSLATTDYRVPALVQRVALDDRPERAIRARHGLAVEEAADYGVDSADPDDQLFFWGSLAMGHRDVVETAMEVCPPEYGPRYGEIRPAFEYHAERADDPGYEPDPNNTAMTGADVYTFHTPDYMLSCAQDYRKGKLGFQQHVWNALVGGDDPLPVFATHPGSESTGPGAGRWAGNGVLPRAAAHRNVLVSLHRFEPGELPHAVPDVPGLDARQTEPDYTHAYFPRGAFDEWTADGGWTFGRRGDGYVALRAAASTDWAEPREADRDLLPVEEWPPEPYELVARGTNAWLCELGRRETHGSFEAFVEAVATASVASDGAAVTYDSPSAGTVSFDWDGAFTVDDEAVPLSEYPRLDSPYGDVALGDARYALAAGDDELVLDFGR